jgi:hypothetical protein
VVAMQRIERSGESYHKKAATEQQGDCDCPRSTITRLAKEIGRLYLRDRFEMFFRVRGDQCFCVAALSGN